MAHRLEKLPANAARDALWMAPGRGGDGRVRAAAGPDRPATGAPDDPVAQVRWMIEELRVGLFAQAVGTPRPISEQRVYKAIDQISA